MLCQQCKKNPVAVNYIEIINGEKHEFHFCASCYAKRYEKSARCDDLCAGFFGTVKKRKSCPVCGTTYEDYERFGLLGCPGCYDVFKEELLPSIMRIQGKVEHVGKVGSNTDDLGLHRRLKGLQEQLEEALREKNYAQADKLNRQINGIKKTLHGGGTA